MTNFDIMDVVQQQIESVIFKDWKHEGYIDGFYSDSVYFVVDGKYYRLSLVEGVKPE